MNADIEVYTQADISADELADVESALRELGLRPTIRVLPTRRGLEVSWLVLVTFPAQAMLRSMLDKFGADAYESLKELAARVRHRPRAGSGAAVKAVVLQSADTGARITLEPDLPAEAFRTLADKVLSGSDGGEWHYDRQQGRWRVAVAG